jgi:hypothetical protein
MFHSGAAGSPIIEERGILKNPSKQSLRGLKTPEEKGKSLWKRLGGRRRRGAYYLQSDKMDHDDGFGLA